MPIKDSNLQTRLSLYRAQSGSIPAAVAVAAAAAWTFAAPQQAKATVNTFAFSVPGSTFNVLFTRSAPTAIFAGGPAGSLWNINGSNSLIAKESAQAFGSGSDFVLDIGVNIGDTISTAGLYPTGTVTGPANLAIIALRYVSGGDNFFGWLTKTGSNVTVGFSDQPNTGVLAGTTTEVGAAAVPEPSTALPLLLLGAAGVAANRRRQMKTEAQAAS